MGGVTIHWTHPLIGLVRILGHFLPIFSTWHFVETFVKETIGSLTLLLSLIFCPVLF